MISRTTVRLREFSAMLGAVVLATSAGFALLVGMSAATAGTAQARDVGGDPFNSMQWPALRKEFLGDKSPATFDARVKVSGPRFAEDAMNVPIAIDARELANVGGGIERIVVLVDRNPIRKVLEFMPEQVRPTLAFRFRLEQGSAVRAAVRTRDGRWHVGGTWVDAAGGGCTVPGATRADGSWSRTLNQVQARLFPGLLSDASARLRIRVMHPMDTGLVAGIPAFYLERLELTDGAGARWFSLLLYEPVAENPMLSFDLARAPGGPMLLTGVDNNGNRLHAEVQP